MQDVKNKANKETFYISTPIYYTSGNLHMGNCYSTVAADAMARYKRARGYDVFFLTGTDEHGQKVQDRAAAAGMAPKEFVDGLVAGIKDLWKLYDISYDYFIRTTDKDHEARVTKIFQRLYDQGDIYKDEYEGMYCQPCEAFWTETQLKNGLCPDCEREVTKTKEESYFFRLSKYADRLIEVYRNNPEFVQPVSRANEMLNNFLLPGLQDLAVSRTSFDWGIKVPFDPKHVIYVWIDALTNYITALGYPDKEEMMNKFWPGEVHLVGKEIVRFHTIIWPILLMALDLPLPKQVYGHGWLLFEEGKMSKSKGNVIDPVVLSERYSVEAIRYFLLRAVPFGADGAYSNEALIQRINSDLANDLGNLLSRTTAMLNKYFDGKLPDRLAGGPEDHDLELKAMQTTELYCQHMDKMEFHLALTEVWKLIGAANKYIDVTMPWILAKDEAKHDRLAMVLKNLAEVLRLVTIYIAPFMPTTAVKLQEALQLDNTALEFANAFNFNSFAPQNVITAAKPMFPRLDLDEELAYLDTLVVKDTKAETLPEAAEKAVAESKPAAQTTAESTIEGVSFISFDDFAKVDLKVGRIIACEKVEGADKLLKETINMGDHQRTVVSGIAPYYSPEELIGKQVIVVTNLKPRKLRGVLSEGMLLAADTGDGGCRLLTIDGEVPAGSQVG